MSEYGSEVWINCGMMKEGRLFDPKQTMSSRVTVTSLEYASVILFVRWSKLPAPPGFPELSKVRCSHE